MENLLALLEAQTKAEDALDAAVREVLKPQLERVNSAVSLEDLEAVRDELHVSLPLKIKDNCLEYHCFYSLWARKWRSLGGK